MNNMSKHERVANHLREWTKKNEAKKARHTKREKRMQSFADEMMGLYGGMKLIRTFRHGVAVPCECCGHTHMKNVHELKNATGMKFWVGSTCASRLTASA